MSKKCQNRLKKQALSFGGYSNKYNCQYLSVITYVTAIIGNANLTYIKEQN